jgi:hypothetical protein
VKSNSPLVLWPSWVSVDHLTWYFPELRAGTVATIALLSALSSSTFGAISLVLLSLRLILLKAGSNASLNCSRITFGAMFSVLDACGCDAAGYSLS